MQTLKLLEGICFRDLLALGQLSKCLKVFVDQKQKKVEMESCWSWPSSDNFVGNFNFFWNMKIV